MRTKITLEEFLFTLNQDEDLIVTLRDFDARIGSILWHGWKSDIRMHYSQYETYKGWYVQGFLNTIEGMEVIITKELEE